MFHSKVFTPLTVLAVVKYIFLGVGIALLVTVIGLMVYTRYQVGSNRPMTVVIDFYFSSTSAMTECCLFQSMQPMKLHHSLSETSVTKYTLINSFLFQQSFSVQNKSIYILLAKILLVTRSVLLTYFLILFLISNKSTHTNSSKREGRLWNYWLPIAGNQRSLLMIFIIKPNK